MKSTQRSMPITSSSAEGSSLQEPKPTGINTNSLSLSMVVTTTSNCLFSVTRSLVAGIANSVSMDRKEPQLGPSFQPLLLSVLPLLKFCSQSIGESEKASLWPHHHSTTTKPNKEQLHRFPPTRQSSQSPKHLSIAISLPYKLMMELSSQ